LSDFPVEANSCSNSFFFSGGDFHVFFGIGEGEELCWAPTT